MTRGPDPNRPTTWGSDPNPNRPTGGEFLLIAGYLNQLL